MGEWARGYAAGGANPTWRLPLMSTLTGLPVVLSVIAVNADSDGFWIVVMVAAVALSAALGRGVPHAERGRRLAAGNSNQGQPRRQDG